MSNSGNLVRNPVAVTGLSDADGSKHAGVAQLTQYDGVVELERALVRVRLDATHEERLRLTQSLHQLLQRKLFTNDTVSKLVNNNRSYVKERLGD